MKKIEAVIFDMDGVIFDTEKIYLNTWQKVFKKYGYGITKDDYTEVMGRGRKNVIKTFLNKYGKDMPIEEMYKEKDYELNKFMRENKVPIKKGAIELLDYLNDNGYKVALATSSKRHRAKNHLRESNLESKFHQVVCGDEITNSKPNPEIFLKAAEKLDVKNEKCIVIEDSPAGLKAAFDAGMTVINVPDLKETDDEMRKNLHEVFESLIEVKEYLDK